MSEPRRLLNLVSVPTVNTDDDFRELAGWIMERDPELLVQVLPDVAGADAASPDLPTLTVSPGPARQLRPRRGALLQGQHLPKSAEYRALEAIGVPVPRWVRLLPGKSPDLSALGNFVVTKPDFGARGADVRIERREHAQWTRPRTELAENFGGHFNPRLAQDLVYTGRWPISHRVATLFGTALFAFTIEASHDREPLVDRSSFSGQSIVSSGRGCRFSLCHDAEIIALGERAHAAFPRAPLLGADIVRDADSGQLFVLELNSIGSTWHFSSPSGRKFQAQFGFDLAAQLDGRRRAAAVLAEACARHAR
ncbi:MAG TPA: hypothetical protein VEQ58_22020 [Polyangiaceae bacterium]|nr:hypothetical protein [Polyangiaceae bacterium]